MSNSTSSSQRKSSPGPLEDKVSFKKGAGGEEVWALSRRKLESLRTLSGTPTASNGAMDKSASMNLGAYIQAASQNGRRATFMAKKQQQVLLQPLELLACKRKLSDPQIQAALVAAEDDAVSLSAWMADASVSNVNASTPQKLLLQRSQERQAVTEPRHRRQSTVVNTALPASLKAAKMQLRQLASELQVRMPPPGALREAFERRDARIRQEFEAARANPLHHLENVTGTTARSRAKTMKSDAEQLITETAQMVSAPAAPQSMAASANLAASTLGKKLQTRKDCVLEFDTAQDRYVLKYATCDRMVTSLVDRFWEVQRDKKMDKKVKKARLAEVTANARHFCIGSLKLWSAAEVLDAMVRLMNDLVAHEKKMQGTEWAASTADLACLERLVLVWLQECFPRCVKDSVALNCFTTLVAAMPNRDAIEEEIVLLSQAKSDVFKRTVGKKNMLKRTLGLFSAPRNDVDSNEFMRLDVLEVSSGDLALELTRLSLSLFREIAMDKLAKRDLGVDPNVARGAKSYLDLPPLFVLRSRTERLSHWAASVVLGEKQLSRRVALFSKLIAVAARLVDMRNMHDAVAIITAMHNPAVSRLRQTNTAAGETVNSAFHRLTTLIRPPYQNMRRKIASWAESTEKVSAYLPSLEVLLQDMAKLDEVERNFVPHPDNANLLLGNIWKTNLLGSWVAKFCDGFANRFFDFEGSESSARSQVIASLVRVLPDVWDDDTLWAMSQKLEASAL